MSYRSYLRPGAVSGDPYPLMCKFGKCRKCNKPMAGEPGYYWPKVKVVYCEECGAAEYQQFLSTAWDEAGVPYAS